MHKRTWYDKKYLENKKTAPVRLKYAKTNLKLQWISKIKLIKSPK